MQHQQWNIPGGEKAIVSFQADIEKLKRFIQQQRQIRERLQGGRDDLLPTEVLVCRF